MTDYWFARDLLQAVGWIYFLLVGFGLAMTLWLPRRKDDKFVLSAILLVIASGPVIHGYQNYQRGKQAAQEFKQRYAKAEALFHGRCAAAGEKLYRVVAKVEGVRIRRVRAARINERDQYALDDPYGRDLGEAAYVASFLRPVGSGAGQKGYLYADVRGDADGVVRYELIEKRSKAGTLYTELREIKVVGGMAQYGVEYEDISSRQDREHWIAGGSLRVIDTSTGEVLGERIGYLFDPALGNTKGGRGPWEAAMTCGNEDRKYGHNARFVMRVLRPKEG